MYNVIYITLICIDILYKPCHLYNFNLYRMFHLNSFYLLYALVVKIFIFQFYDIDILVLSYY
jgi:hypothetical protein